MTRDAEHSFLCLWVLWMSSLEKCLLRSFALFLIGLFVFLEWNCVSSLYILEIKSLPKVSLANVFFHMVGSLFSTTSSALVVCWFVYDGHSDQCEVVSHCGFNLHLSDTSDAEHLFLCLWILCMSSLEKCLFKSFAHFLIVFFLSSLSGVLWVLYIFWRSNPFLRYHWQICFPIQLVPF